MKYKLTYKIARKPNDSPVGEVGLFSENVEENLILQRMKEVQNEHNDNVREVRALPQFAEFFPIEIAA